MDRGTRSPGSRTTSPVGTATGSTPTTTTTAASADARCRTVARLGKEASRRHARWIARIPGDAGHDIGTTRHLGDGGRAALRVGQRHEIESAAVEDRVERACIGEARALAPRAPPRAVVGCADHDPFSVGKPRRGALTPGAERGAETPGSVQARARVSVGQVARDGRARVTAG